MGLGKVVACVGPRPIHLDFDRRSRRGEGRLRLASRSVRREAGHRLLR